MMTKEKELTGYPSIDKPWLKYYSDDAINAPIPDWTIYRQIVENNKSNLNGKAISYFEKSITYMDLFAEIDAVANAFWAVGVRTGDVVNIALPNIPENIYIVYALNKIGAVANLIDLRTKGKNLIAYMNETTAKITVVCDIFAQNTIDIMNQTNLEKIIVVSPFDAMIAPLRMFMKRKYRFKLPSYAMSWKEFINIGRDLQTNVHGGKDDIACILHTSGTTGLSKGVMLTNKNLNAMILQYQLNGMEYERGGLFLNQVPPFLAYNIVLATHLPLSLSMHLRLLPDYQPDKFADNIMRIKPNHVVAGPADWNSFLSNKKVLKKDFSFLKTLASGSDTMSIAAKQKVNTLLNDNGCTNSIMEGYGMTEVGSAACTNLPQHDVEGSVGVPLPKMNFCIWDNENGKELSYGELGEICITGDTMMLGYYGNENETRKVMRLHKDGNVWLHTGDLGYISEEGNIFLEGRLKRIIVRYDGMKVSPFQIEALIRDNENVQDCCVVGKHDEAHGYGALPVAFIVMKGKQDDTNVIKQLKETCLQRLAEICIPDEYVVIDALPLTPNGKVDYRALEEMVACNQEVT